MPSGVNTLDIPFDLEWGGEEDDKLLSVGGSDDKDLIAAVEPQVKPGDSILLVEVEVTWSYDEGIRSGPPDRWEAPSSEDERVIQRVYVEGPDKEEIVGVSKFNKKAMEVLESLVHEYEIDYDRLDSEDDPDEE